MSVMPGDSRIADRALTNIAWNLESLGRDEELIAAYRQLIDLAKQYPKDAMPSVYAKYIGENHEKMGRYDQGDRSIQGEISLATSDSEVTWGYFDLGDDL